MTAHSDRTIELLEDAPLALRVELGTVTVSLREWSELGPGDVITLARSSSDPVVMRIGGVEVGLAELVLVDGEVGVRILSTKAFQ